MRSRFAVAGNEEEENEINITPMLDVVFIMLIFFIVTASFVKELGLDVNRPDSDTAQRQDQKNILVVISATNEILIDRRQVDPRALRANIERLRAENPEASVVIQANKASVTETLIRVMDSARQAGIYNVSIATDET